MLYTLFSPISLAGECSAQTTLRDNNFEETHSGDKLRLYYQLATLSAFHKLFLGQSFGLVRKPTVLDYSGNLFPLRLGSEN